MNEDAIQKILNYEKEFLFEPYLCWSKEDIQKQAYARWTVDEILTSIMDHPFTEPELIVENFIIKIEYLLHISENATANTIFTIAENTAENLLGLIL
ncbi:MAG: hypothetical protein Q4F83_12160 [Eubacteriales bacterium]|nr:hypothetical protein [Eubacteriales bacterium]